MTHWHYIGMAYAAFAALLVWDFWVPRIALKQHIRRMQLKQRRTGS